MKRRKIDFLHKRHYLHKAYATPKLEDNCLNNITIQ